MVGSVGMRTVTTLVTSGSRTKGGLEPFGWVQSGSNRPEMDQKALAEIKKLEAMGKYEDPRYMELLIPNYYAHHLLRIPLPDPAERAFKHANRKIYVPMQGPSEMGASGKLVKWDRHGGHQEHLSADVGDRRPLRHDGSQADGMGGEPDSQGPLSVLPDGSHLAEYDDQQKYFTGLIGFLKDVDRGKI
jgi:proline iminopeptidase